MSATDNTLNIIHGMAATVEEYRTEPMQLDSAIGDGYRGTNMRRSFQAALERLEESSLNAPADDDIIRTEEFTGYSEAEQE